MKDNHPTDSISRLEAMLADHCSLSSALFKESHARIKALTGRVNQLSSSLERLDTIEPMLFEAYAETHPQAERDLLTVERATDWDFISLPSIRDMRRRS